MTDIIDMLVFEEGFRSRAYLDSEGFPTIGIGFLLAKRKCTRSELKEFYDFELPLPAAEAWLGVFLKDLIEKLGRDPRIAPALDACFHSIAEPWATNPRVAVLVSMGYQLGLEGLAKFTTTLGHIAAGRFTDAAGARRAARHATQMATGQWAEEYLE